MWHLEYYLVVPLFNIEKEVNVSDMLDCASESPRIKTLSSTQYIKLVLRDARSGVAFVDGAEELRADYKAVRKWRDTLKYLIKGIEAKLTRLRAMRLAKMIECQKGERFNKEEYLRYLSKHTRKRADRMQLLAVLLKRHRESKELLYTLVLSNRHMVTVEGKSDESWNV